MINRLMKCFIFDRLPEQGSSSNNKKFLSLNQNVSSLGSEEIAPFFGSGSIKSGSFAVPVAHMRSSHVSEVL